MVIVDSVWEGCGIMGGAASRMLGRGLVEGSASLSTSSVGRSMGGGGVDKTAGLFIRAHIASMSAVAAEKEGTVGFLVSCLRCRDYVNHCV